MLHGRIVHKSFTARTAYCCDGKNSMTTQQSRPLGVVILVVLEVLGGILGLGGGLLLLGIADIMTFRPRVEVLLLVLGLIFAIMGAIQLFLAYGVWNGRGWAWTWTLIFAIIGIVLSVVSLARGHIWGIVRLIGDVLLIWYLNTPRVKGFFRKTTVTSSNTA